MDEDEYRTESEVEADSDHEDGDGDGDQEYGGWLAHFNSAEDVDSDGTGTVRRRNKTIVTPKMAMESFRFSFLNNEENQDVNFDAILGELCELETQLSTTQSELSRSLASCPTEMVNEHHPNVKKDGGGGGNDMIQAELDALAAEITQGLGYRNNVRTYNGQTVLDTTYDAGETDSAFSDNASLPSSESFTSMVTVSSSADTTSSSSGDTCSTSSAISAVTLQGEVHAHIVARLLQIQEDLDKEQIPREEQRARLKAEKIRIALEKIKEAKIRKLFVRAFAKDGSSKSILVDEKMTVGQVASVLADKNHMRLNHHLTVVEHMPDMLMERILEDHDSLVENMVMWTRDSKNKILFEERPEKYDLFKHPEKYLLVGTSSEKGLSLGPSQQERLVQEFFSSSCVKVPEVEGALYLKSDGKKAWKKYFFVLRASGLYYNPKGKISKSPKDLACLVQFDFVEPYHGVGWKKKYHAPTDHCFALKHPQIQKKNSKYIRYLCAESKTSMDQWIMGVRIAKLGKQLMYNYEKVQHEVSMWDLRDFNLTNAAQCSNIQEQLLLNNVGNLQDSRMSVPEPGSRHSIVTVKNASLVRKNSTGGPDCDNPNEVIGIEVTPMPPRKGSLGGYSGGDPSPQPKTPVKRVSFSNTHCIINADSNAACEEMIQMRHRDSITSASTDSSEDSASSGEGKHNQGGTRGKLRPKLPVTTETTRQLSEMFQISMDTCSVASGDSAFSEDRKSYIEKRRSSSSSTHSDKIRQHSESERHKSESIKEQRMSSSRSSGPMSPLSPPPQRQTSEVYSQPPQRQTAEVYSQPPQRQTAELYSQPLQRQTAEVYSQPKAAVTPPQAPAPVNTVPPPPPPNAMMGHPPPPPPNATMGHPPPPPSQMAHPHPTSAPPPPPQQMPKHPGSMPPPPPSHQRNQGHVPLPPPPNQHQGSIPQPPVMPPPPTIPAPASPVPGGAKRPSVSTPAQNTRAQPPPPPPQGRGPPPPPPVKTTPSPKQNPMSPMQSHGPPSSAMSPPPAPVTGMQKFTGPFSPQLSRVERHMNGTASPSSRSTMSPGSSPGGPPTTAPKPKPPPLSPVGNQNLGSKSPRNSPTVLSPPPPPNGMHIGHTDRVDSPSAMDKGAGIPMPPPMPLLQSSPTQTISQRISHIKHPSTGTPLSQNMKQGPSQTVLQKNRVTNNGGVYEEIDNESSLPFLAELSKRSHNHPPQYGHPMAHANHTAECVSMPSQNNAGPNHRRSASAGGNVIKPPGPPVAQKPDSKRAMPPPPPKRSEHTRLSSDQARQLQQQLQLQHQQQQPQQQLQQSGGESPAVADPIYENCEGIMDINELPPPPPELLEGLSLQQQEQQQKAMQGCKKPRPPPPPPKRSKDTHLSH